MKKLLAISLALVLVLGCTAAFADTFGLGLQTSIDSSAAAAADKDGNAQVDTTVCAVTVDADGKIVSVLFDVAQTKVSFSAGGEITADMDAEIKSKMEKGPEYNMKVASPIGKEWNEQAAALAEFCVGKTFEEVVAGVALDENGYATSPDVTAGCTIHAADFIKALEKAYNMAAGK